MTTILIILGILIYIVIGCITHIIWIKLYVYNYPEPEDFIEFIGATFWPIGIPIWLIGQIVKFIYYLISKIIK